MFTFVRIAKHRLLELRSRIYQASQYVVVDVSLFSVLLVCCIIGVVVLLCSIAALQCCCRCNACGFAACASQDSEQENARVREYSDNFGQRCQKFFARLAKHHTAMKANGNLMKMHPASFCTIASMVYSNTEVHATQQSSHCASQC